MLKSGNKDSRSPNHGSVVTVHYTGKTINGKTFDSSRGGVAPPFRLREHRGYNAVMLVAHAPYGKQWIATIIPALKALTDKHTDGGKAGIYVMGGSMGGNGTWIMAQRDHIHNINEQKERDDCYETTT